MNLYKDENAAKEIGFEYVDLDTLFKNSDIISLHCPLTPETNKIINKESISKMKNGVVILNTSRGKLIDTEALIEEMMQGKNWWSWLRCL